MLNAPLNKERNYLLLIGRPFEFFAKILLIFGSHCKMTQIQGIAEFQNHIAMIIITGTLINLFHFVSRPWAITSVNKCLGQNVQDNSMTSAN